MGKKSKVTITDKLIKDLTEYSKNFRIGMATKTRDNLAKATAVAIEMFYQDYTPKYYKRHIRNGKHYNFGELSFEKYYYNKHGSVIRGGVKLSPEQMESIYQDSKEEVFDMFYAGYHGVASGFVSPYTFTPVPVMSPSPLEIIEESRNNFVKHINVFEIYGYQRAKNGSYDTLELI